MNRPDEMLNRLATQARRQEESASEMPPYLPMRVLALLHDQPSPVSLWERLTLRAVPVAVLALVICALLAPHTSIPDDNSADAFANDVFNDLLTP